MHRARSHVFRGRRGFTLLEVMMAAFLSSAVAIGMSTLLLFSSRMLKENFSQRRHMQAAKSLVELFNQQLRPARSDRTQVMSNGTRIDFSWPGEPDFRRRIRLLGGADGNLATPWDNTVEFDPNVNSSGDERVVASYVTGDGIAFERLIALDAIRIRLRVGDPVTTDEALRKASDAITGIGLQGTNIDLRVMPRNAGN